jgi:hypothetical protein
VVGNLQLKSPPADFTAEGLHSRRTSQPKDFTGGVHRGTEDWLARCLARRDDRHDFAFIEATEQFLARYERDGCCFVGETPRVHNEEFHEQEIERKRERLADMLGSISARVWNRKAASPETWVRGREEQVASFVDAGKEPPEYLVNAEARELLDRERAAAALYRQRAEAATRAKAGR